MDPQQLNQSINPPSAVRVLSFAETPPETADVFSVPLARVLDQGLGLSVTGNSGAGKTHAVRGVLEQTFGRILHIVFDVEGEFATLRAKFDYLLAAKNSGDIRLSVATAPLLAQRVMEIGVSVILDISDLKPDERFAYVAAFVEQLIEMPSEFRRDALVVIDEVHLFAPQTGKAPPSKSAIANLVALGRKRGLRPVLATQRIAKVDKDVIAEIPNKLVGRTNLDNDMDRAGDDLGLRKSDYSRLQTLPKGHFFALGPLFSDTVIEVQTGPNLTAAPPRGVGALSATPATPDAIKGLLEKFADLPAEAAEEAKNLKQARVRITDLEKHLAARPGSVVEVKTPPERIVYKKEIVKEIEYVEKPILSEEDLARAESFHRSFLANADLLQQRALELKTVADAMMEESKGAKNVANEMGAKLARHRLSRSAVAVVPPPASPVQPAEAPATLPPAGPNAEPYSSVRKSKTGKRSRTKAASVGVLSLAPSPGMTNPQQKIINALATFGRLGRTEPERALVATWAGYSATGGGFRNYLAELRGMGLLEYVSGDRLALTDAGRRVAHIDLPKLETVSDLHAAWLSRMTNPQQRLATVLIRAYPLAVRRDALASETGYSVSGGGFRNYMGELRGLGVAEYPDGQTIRATDLLFPAELWNTEKDNARAV